IVERERRRAARRGLDRRHVAAEFLQDRAVAEAGLEHQRMQRLVHPAVVVHDVNQAVRIALVPGDAYLQLGDHPVSDPPRPPVRRPLSIIALSLLSRPPNSKKGGSGPQMTKPPKRGKEGRKRAAREPRGPLAGVRVVDMTTVLMGPYATQILADYGADVIKVEPPEGDIMRHAGPMRNPRMGPMFFQANRNKRSVVIDIKTPGGRGALRRLCGSADVFICNVRPAALRRHGLGPDDIPPAH